jgi:hypothetical protein
MKTFSLSFTLLFLAVLSPLSAISQGTTFNYQGQLDVSNSPANGTYQMQFTLYPSSSSVSATAGPVTNTAVAVTNGIFTTSINFGLGAFTGNASWLDIAVRTNLPASFTELSPRQQILPVPYAIFAAGASNAVNANTAITAGSAGSAGTATSAGSAAVAESVAPGAITGASIAAGSLTVADFANDELVTNINSLSGGITLAVSNNITLSTNGNTLTLGSSGDYLFAYLNVGSSAVTVDQFHPIPITAPVGSGWQYLSPYGASQPVFVVPDTGIYLIQIDGTASSSTPNPIIGVEYGATINSTATIAGSDAYVTGAQFTHSFLAQLTAGYVIYFSYVGSSSSILFGPVSGGGIVFSFTITRIN